MTQTGAATADPEPGAPLLDFTVSVGRPADTLTPAARARRTRLRQAAIAEVARLGYQTATVTDIVRVARVSRTSFYELYSGKEECFLDAYVSLQRVLYNNLRWSGGFMGDPEEFLVRGLDVYLAAMFNDTLTIRALLIELSFVGPTALDYRQQVFDIWARLLRHRMIEATRRQPELLDGRQVPSELAVVAALTGVDELIRRAILAGDSTPSAELRSTALRILLATASAPVAAESRFLERRYPQHRAAE
jgi:AcrR family transcriptional regulator